MSNLATVTTKITTRRLGGQSVAFVSPFIPNLARLQQAPGAGPGDGSRWLPCLLKLNR